MTIPHKFAKRESNFIVSAEAELLDWTSHSALLVKFSISIHDVPLHQKAKCVRIPKFYEVTFPLILHPPPLILVPLSHQSESTTLKIPEAPG